MDDEPYRFEEGSLPLLVSVPHDGREVPASIGKRMTDAARALPDTDWHVARLYDFARGLGASVLCATWSRYVVDLNRPPDDAELYPGQGGTGLCPAQTFGGAPIYRDGGEVGDDERKERVERYWQPYHRQIEAELARLADRHGAAYLWDAHSIPSRVPMLFEGELPVLNLGSNDGKSCPPEVLAAVAAVAAASTYSSVVDARFRGGYITRHYGRAQKRVSNTAPTYALQLELSQRCYMDEETLRYDDARAAALVPTLEAMLRAFIEAN